MYVAFHFGAKLTILGATNGFGRGKSRLKFEHKLRRHKHLKK